MQRLENIKRTNCGGQYRKASELFPIFGYEHFGSVIEEIKKICLKNGKNLQDHVIDYSLTGNDFLLSEYACYIISEKIKITDTELKKIAKRYFYKKDFDGWNDNKKKVDNGDFEPRNSKWIKEREVWDCKLGVNIGNEANGKGKFMRPVLVMKQVGNMFLVVPLSKQGKNTGERYAEFYHKLQVGSFEFDSYALLSQIKVIDSKRFIKNIGVTICEKEFIEIKNRLRDLYLPNEF